MHIYECRAAVDVPSSTGRQRCELKLGHGNCLLSNSCPRSIFIFECCSYDTLAVSYKVAGCRTQFPFDAIRCDYVNTRQRQRLRQCGISCCCQAARQSSCLHNCQGSAKVGLSSYYSFLAFAFLSCLLAFLSWQ